MACFKKFRIDLSFAGSQKGFKVETSPQGM